MRFLVVEDDFASRKLLQVYLKKFGFTDVDMVVNGKEAVQAFNLAWEEELPYDVIFLDIMMPGMDGQEALQKMRAKEMELKVKPSKEVIIIMVSALGDPTNVIQAFNKGGATGYLVKPIEPEDLRTELKKYKILL